MTLPRGFRAHAEREALRLRAELSVPATAPINVTQLALHLKIRVVSAGDLVDRARLEQLERLQAFSFSAATFDVGDRPVIVTNPLRSPRRLTSDIAHELAHLLLHHQLSEIQELDGVPFRTCQPEQEEQATSFGGALMLPRPLLVAAAVRGHGPEEIAASCGVTVEMARFRYNTTGVAKQVRHRTG